MTPKQSRELADIKRELQGELDKAELITEEIRRELAKLNKLLLG